MKYNYLKKAGAVALAAVMAVTFAPVASLDVFAGANTSDKSIAYTAGNADPITVGGITYKVTTTTFGDIVVSGKGIKVTIDLNGQESDGGKITATAGAIVTVINSQKAGKQANVPTLAGVTVVGKSGQPAGVESSVTLGEGIGVAPYTYTGAGLAAATARVNNEDYIGNTTINAVYGSNTSYKTVEARHGAVTVSKLWDGDEAFVGWDADTGTTITASTDADTTLKKYVTVYDFGYATKEDLTAGTKGNKLSGTGTYTDTRYVAGINTPQTNKAYTSNANLDNDETDENTGANGSDIFFNTSGIAYKYILSNTKASNSTNHVITVSTSGGLGYPLTGYTGITYTFGKDKGKGYILPANEVNTYYTFDVKDYTDDGEAIALIDGNEWVKGGEDGTLSDNYVAPKKSYELVQSSAYTKEDGNKNAKVDIRYYASDVTLKAPEDVTVASETDTYVSGKTTKTRSYATFFGAGKGDSLPDTPIKDSVAGVELYVQQVSSAAKTAVFKGVDINATVDRATGIGYYRDNLENLTFGTTKNVTDAFVDAAQGTTNNGLRANPDFRDGTVFASKEIKTTVKGVNADVTMLGEISAEATATAADGSKTWEINLADTATNDKAVVAYRLYDGNRGEHIYTYNPVERDMLVKSGWKEETSDIKVLPVDAKTGVTVYRVYNPNNGGAHVYTTNPEEVKMLLAAGWEEGVAVFKTPAAGTANTLPVYRVYNTGSKNGEHQFTTSAAEKDNLVNHGWKLEGTPWYSFK